MGGRRERAWAATEAGDRAERRGAVRASRLRPPALASAAPLTAHLEVFAEVGHALGSHHVRVVLIRIRREERAQRGRAGCALAAAAAAPGFVQRIHRCIQSPAVGGQELGGHPLAGTRGRPERGNALSLLRRQPARHGGGWGGGGGGGAGRTGRAGGGPPEAGGETGDVRVRGGSWVARGALLAMPPSPISCITPLLAPPRSTGRY